MTSIPISKKAFASSSSDQNKLQILRITYLAVLEGNIFPDFYISCCIILPFPVMNLGFLLGMNYHWLIIHFLYLQCSHLLSTSITTKMSKKIAFWMVSPNGLCKKVLF